MIKLLVLFIATMASLSSTTVIAADGKALYVSRDCISCHGVEGRGKTDKGHPRLSCQQEKYLITQMQDISKGIRKAGQGKSKCGLSKASHGDFDALADYLSKVRPCL
ncbi:MAG: c-type cytochrome [Deltaproteobacteria bacterium]|nr:MAG: c-type cytochrome [Deltaproteobacteria bacterium]